MTIQKVLVGGDFNGHVGSDMVGFGEVYGVGVGGGMWGGGFEIE